MSSSDQACAHSIVVMNCHPAPRSLHAGGGRPDVGLNKPRSCARMTPGPQGSLGGRSRPDGGKPHRSPPEWGASMKSLVIHDSEYGNTEKVARAIAAGLKTEPLGEVRHAEHITPDLLQAADLLVVGSPTQAFRPTKSVADFLDKLPIKTIKGCSKGRRWQASKRAPTPRILAQHFWPA